MDVMDGASDEVEKQMSSGGDGPTGSTVLTTTRKSDDAAAGGLVVTLIRLAFEQNPVLVRRICHQGRSHDCCSVRATGANDSAGTNIKSL